ncbi:hypothetical protein [Pseudomonas asplenii]|uniref:hypothetical protein n=1 Tax=Pseudomonas asplenii TaxID=53407 RepID=UPI0006B68B89|nr:hypothetical protein [Pseudomonas fuscovaginae]KPA96922.1 hypothetical protein PF70_03078 [Pseudomonas fuscovaginae]
MFQATSQLSYSVIAFRLDHKTFCLETRINGEVTHRVGIDQSAMMDLKSVSGSSAQRLEALRKDAEEQVGMSLRLALQNLLKSKNSLKEAI